MKLFKLVNTDFTTRNGYTWPFPGGVASEEKTATEHDSPCPKFPGDGLCVAKTFSGACSGGAKIASSVGLWVTVNDSDILASDNNKIRARRVSVDGIFNPLEWIKKGNETNLAGAYLTGADLTSAYLAGADLAGAYLARADLAGADLDGANLAGANLTGADLTGADLAGAYLTGADLTGADLAGAYLARADLAGARGLPQ